MISQSASIRVPRANNLSLSVIIPCFNEGKRIALTLKKCQEFFSEFFGAESRYEIIVVDDGSSDGTSSTVKTFFPDVRLSVLNVNKGKGAAVKAGVLVARGDFYLFMDADCSTPLDEFIKIYSKKRNGSCVIGSRYINGRRFILPPPKMRQIISRIFNFTVRLFFGLKIFDTQCGFKLFSAKMAQDIFSRLKTDGFAFDVEVLY